MAIRNEQTGWSNESKLLRYILKQIDRLGILMSRTLSSIPTSLSELTNDTGFITGAQVSANEDASYTFVLGDKGKYIRFSNANPQFVTVPPNSEVAFPVNTVISGVQAGAGSVVVQEGSGVTVNTYDGYMTMGQYAAFDLVKVDTDEWDLIGTMESDVTTTTTTTTP